MKGVSIIICCYNSATRVTPTLIRLARQSAVGLIDMEVIIVDNASEDNTAATTIEMWAKLNQPFPFRIVTESKRGLRYARERGIGLARFEYLLFVDDDNWLYHDYVSKAFDVLNQNPGLAMLGGEGVAISSVELPGWFVHVKSLYAVGAQSPTFILSKKAGFLYGAGMVIRKSYFDELVRLDFPFCTTDRVGPSLSGGHDVELSWAFRLLGKEVGFSPELKFEHFIEKHRVSFSYARKLAIGSAQSVMPFSFYVLMNHGGVSMFRFSFLLLKRVLSSFLWRPKHTPVDLYSAVADEIARAGEAAAARYLLGNCVSAIRYFCALKDFSGLPNKHEA